MYLFGSKRLKINPVTGTLAIFAAIMIFFYIALTNMDKNVDSNEVKTLAEAIDNAVVSHYAINGVYPENLEVIEKEYGIIIDKESFIVSYDIIAPNVMPAVSVFVKEAE